MLFSIQRPFDGIPLPGRDRYLRIRVIPVVVEGVFTLHGGRPLARLQVDVDVDVGHRRHVEVGPGCRVLAPVVLARLLGRRPLTALLSAEVQHRRQHDRRRRERQQAQEPDQQRLRPYAVHKPRGIEVRSPKPLHCQCDKGRNHAQNEETVQQQFAPLKRKRAHVAPLDSAPRDPVQRPREGIVDGHAVDRVDDQSHSDAVHGVAVPEKGEECRHQRGPEDEGGHEHATPGHDERDHVEAHGTAGEELPVYEDPRAGNHAHNQDQSRHDAVADGLAQQNGSGGDRG